MTLTPMFPLGSVLFPHMPLALRLFEPRYLRMLGTLLDRESPAFGVVLIERGHEVGGGDHRFGVGTIAQIQQLDAGEQYVALAARGAARFRVTSWLPDDPYPQAEIDLLPELVWDAGLDALRARTESEVRDTLAAAAEFTDAWPPDVELSDDPVEACWQLAAITPVGALDQVALLQAASLEALLTMTRDAAREAQETLRLGWPGL